MRRDMLDEIAASVIGIVVVWFLIALFVVGAFAFLAPPPAHAASGQGVAQDQTARVEECKQILKDELHISWALSHERKSADQVRADAAQVRGQMGEERYAHVLELIDQADAQYLQGKLSLWFNKYWVACLNPI